MESVLWTSLSSEEVNTFFSVYLFYIYRTMHSISQVEHKIYKQENIWKWYKFDCSNKTKSNDISFYMFIFFLSIPKFDFLKQTKL